MINFLLPVCTVIYTCLTVTGLVSVEGRVSTPRLGGTRLDPGRDIPKLLTMVLVAPRLTLRF